MGQARRRKDKGLMPDKTPRPQKIARMKPDEYPTYGMIGMGGMSMLMGSLLMRGSLGATFAIRSEMARLNHKREMGIDESSNSDQGNV